MKTYLFAIVALMGFTGCRLEAPPLSDRNRILMDQAADIITDQTKEIRELKSVIKQREAENDFLKKSLKEETK